MMLEMTPPPVLGLGLPAGTNPALSVASLEPAGR
jgi:hypothetical protein